MTDEGDSYSHAIDRDAAHIAVASMGKLRKMQHIQYRFI